MQTVEIFTKLTKGKVEQSGSRFTALFFWETGFIFDNIYQFLVHSQFMVRSAQAVVHCIEVVVNRYMSLSGGQGGAFADVRPLFTG